ncbi:MAG TPA: hypothetical protein VHG08_22620 [Longimicrobium sp.]|nr:hypothetical protein [Longimicrobium sp.]
MAPPRRSFRLPILVAAAALGGCFWPAPPPVNPYQATSDEMNTILTQIAWFSDTIGGLPETLQELCPGVERGCPWMLPGWRFTDVWERPFRYTRLGGDEFELRSAGPDGAFDTADDVVYRPSAERALVARASGCYRMVQNGWKEFSGDELRLDSAEVPMHPTFRRGRAYHASPLDAVWEGVGNDSIAVRWVGIHSSMNYVLHVGRDTLSGYSTIGIGMASYWGPDHRRSRVLAVRTACGRGDRE